MDYSIKSLATPRLWDGYPGLVSHVSVKLCNMIKCVIEPGTYNHKVMLFSLCYFSSRKVDLL